MFLHHFKKKETEDKKIAELVYQKIIDNVNLIISSNSRSGGGLNQWKPINLSLLVNDSAINVIGKALVLLAKIVWAGEFWSANLNTLILASRFSIIASITKSDLFTDSCKLENRVIRLIIEVAISEENLFSLTFLFRLSLIREKAVLSTWSDTSTRFTLNPDVANAWAIPCPIVPAPITVMLSIEFEDKLKEIIFIYTYKVMVRFENNKKIKEMYRNLKQIYQ